MCSSYFSISDFSSANQLALSKLIASVKVLKYHQWLMFAKLTMDLTENEDIQV